MTERSAEPVTSPSSRKGKKTRERILHAAEELFHLKGYHAVGLDEILNKAEVAKGNFYYYFSGKEELALETIRRHGQLILEELGIGAAMASLAPRDGLYDILDRIGERLVGRGDEIPGSYLGNLALEISPHSPPMRKEVADCFARIRKTFAELIADGITAGQFNKGIDPEQIAFLMMALLEGGTLLGKVANDPDQIARAISYIKQQVG